MVEGVPTKYILGTPDVKRVPPQNVRWGPRLLTPEMYVGGSGR